MKTFRYHGLDGRGYYTGGNFTNTTDFALDMADVAMEYLGWQRIDIFEVDEEGVPTAIVTTRDVRKGK
jgi:hypothetical protein